jgi:hypothetical protein
VPVRRNSDEAKVLNELRSMSHGEQSGLADRASVEKSKEVVGGGSIAVDRVDRRPPDLVVVFEPAGPQSGNANRLKTESGRGAGFEFLIDLGGELPGRAPVGADARPAALAVFEETEVPDSVAEIASHFSDAERLGARHAILRDPSCHKVPQKPPQTG